MLGEKVGAGVTKCLIAVQLTFYPLLIVVAIGGIAFILTANSVSSERGPSIFYAMIGLMGLLYLISLLVAIVLHIVGLVQLHALPPRSNAKPFLHCATFLLVASIITFLLAVGIAATTSYYTKSECV